MPVSDSTAQRYVQSDPDVRLMLEVRDDSAAAFEELVSRYQSRLIGVLRHLIGDLDQAEDLAQEVFLRVFRARKTYQPGAKFSTWLFAIANNVASNARRTRARRREINLQPSPSGSQSLATIDEMAQAASGLMPIRQVEQMEVRQIVRLAMESLNDRQKLAVLLCKFEHMSYVEIAETMGLSSPAVKSLLSRARGNLRQVLEPYLRDGHRPDGDSQEEMC